MTETLAPAAGVSVAARYATSMRVGIVGILAVWHFVYDVVIISRGWSQYESRTAAVVAWVLVAVAQVAGSMLLLRRDPFGPWLRHLLVSVTLVAAVVATVSYPPGLAVSDVSWAWNTVGWCGALLLIRRPLGELCALLAANSAITVVAVAADGSLDRVMTGKLVIITFATAGVQLLFVVFSQRLEVVARRAAELTLAQAETRSRTASDDAVHAGRQRRYAEIRDRAEPLLRGLADRTADPTDPEVRRTSGLEAARLRRLFAETDDTPDPLVHELRACADLAERRGVEITFLTYGSLPDVPHQARRRLTEVVLLVLVSATTRARLTMVADDVEVVVSVSADAPADVLGDLRGDLPVSVVHDEDANQTWVEVRWRRPSNVSG